MKPLTNEQVINPILNCNSKIDILRVLTKADDPLTGRRIAMLPIDLLSVAYGVGA